MSASGKNAPATRTAAPVRSRAPGISWALVFAGLLGGGALSFGAGVITGNQMSAVTYRGILPDATAPDPAPTASRARPNPARTLLPRDHQVAANPDAARNAPPADAPGPRVGTPAPAAQTDITDVASLISLPQRTLWNGRDQTQAGQDGGLESATQRSRAETAKRSAPPRPRSKPDDLAPRRLTPIDGKDGFGSQGTAAPQRPPSTARAATIWRVTAPTDGSAVPGHWHLFPAGLEPSANLAASANWARSAEGTPATDNGRTPQAAPPAPRTPDAASTAAQSGYSVQVGAFRDPANASAQAARLSAAGYSPRIVRAKATQSRLYMVRLGAFPNRPTARAFASQLAERLDIDTWPVAN